MTTEPLAELVYLDQLNGNAAPRTLSTRRLADVEMRSIEWLDRPLFQRAAFHLLVGDKGVGKGTYIARLAAKVTNGEMFVEPMNVLIVASEDSPEIDVKPRIVAAGGNQDRVDVVDEPLRLPRDLDALRATALKIGNIGLIVIDPIGNHLGGADTDKEGPVREAIGPLNELAHELETLIVGVRHLGKDKSRSALNSVLGSGAWGHVPRAVLAVAADDEEDLVFHIQVVAGNRSARGLGRSFRIELADVGLKEQVTRALELGDSTKDVEALLSEAATGGRTAVKRDSARQIILREIRTAPRPLDYLKAVVASETGASGDTTYRAAQSLKAEGVARPRNSGPGTPWLWTLEPDSAA
jgi:hypothetical protein